MKFEKSNKIMSKKLEKSGLNGIDFEFPWFSKNAKYSFSIGGQGFVFKTLRDMSICLYSISNPSFDEKDDNILNFVLEYVQELMKENPDRVFLLKLKNKTSSDGLYIQKVKERLPEWTELGLFSDGLKELWGNGAVVTYFDTIDFEVEDDNSFLYLVSNIDYQKHFMSLNQFLNDFLSFQKLKNKGLKVISISNSRAFVEIEVLFKSNVRKIAVDSVKGDTYTFSLSVEDEVGNVTKRKELIEVQLDKTIIELLEEAEKDNVLTNLVQPNCEMVIKILEKENVLTKKSKQLVSAFLENNKEIVPRLINEISKADSSSIVVDEFEYFLLYDISVIFIGKTSLIVDEVMGNVYLSFTKEEYKANLHKAKDVFINDLVMKIEADIEKI